MATTLADLRSEVDGTGPDREYVAKMLHRVPDATVVRREVFIGSLAAGKRVLSLGHSGPLAEILDAVAASCVGVDKPESGTAIGCDLDAEPGRVAGVNDVELIVCGEVIEHLTNPGMLLRRLKAAYDAPLVVSVPNAHSRISRKHLEETGRENVHIEHVAWYSWRTLKTLLERCGWQPDEWHWYNGPPLFAEGIIVVAR